MIEYLPIALLIVLLMLGIPIAFALAFSGIIGLALVSNWLMVNDLLVFIVHNAVAQYLFIALPMFLLFGYLAENTGLSQGTFNAAAKWLGGLPAGLAIATIAASAVFSAACGSTTAACAVFARLAVPEMERAGYDRGFSMGLVASSAVMAVMIPPSTALLIYGILTETSVVKLFAGGVLPGILIAFVFTLIVLVLAKIKPQLVPGRQKVSWKERFISLRGVLPIVLVAIAILGSIYAGIATITESSAVGVMVTLLILTIQRKLKIRILLSSLFAAARITAMVMAIFIGGLIFSKYISLGGAGRTLVDFILSFQLPPASFLFCLIPAYVLLGMFLDGASILVLTVPLLVPVADAMGIDLIWLGIFITLAIEIGCVTPPVALNIFVVVGAVEHGTLEEAFKGAIPFAIGLVLIQVIIILFPVVATWLPGLVK